jgi:Fe-S-cluster containining protein
VSTKEEALLHEIERGIEKETTQKLRANPSAAFAIRLSSLAQQKIDGVYDDVVRKGAHFDCAKGCSFCCRLKVECYAQEAFRIAHELRQRGDVSEITQTLANHIDRNKNVEEKRAREPCPFLVDQACSIYSVRPAACRKCASTDVERCKEFGETVPTDPEFFYKTGAILNGTVKAYARNKLPTTAYELASSVLTALTDATAEARWWKGEDVFAEPK